jgi:hypothetical protein
MTMASENERGGRWPFRVAAAVYALWLVALAALAIAHKFE